MTDTLSVALLDRIERFYDAVPRRTARAEQHDGLTLFVRRDAGWPFYARPTLGAPDHSVESVHRVRARQVELGLPEAFEWVDEVTPGLATVATAAGLTVRRCPLMVLDPSALVEPPLPAGVVATFLDPDRTDGAAPEAEVLAVEIQAVAMVAFASPGTSRGDAGPAELDEQRSTATPLDDAEREGLRSGALARVLLQDATGPVSSGSYQRVDDVVEIVGVATLPTTRRRGLAAALTAMLARHALDRGAKAVFLSAGDPDVARLYRRLGFVDGATACIAEPG